MNRNITSLILIVLAVGVYFTYTSGQISVLNSIQTENSQYISAINNAKKLIQTRDTVLNEYNSISDTDKARLDEMVPNNVDNIRLMIDISGIAARHGITATGITTSADTNTSSSAQSTPNTPNPIAMAGSGLSTVTISFNVTTTYANFISFLQDVERSLRILDVTGITLSPSANGVYTYGVTMNTYWLNQ